MAVSAGTLLFASGLGIWLVVLAFRDREAPTAALVALEATMVVFAGAHLMNAMTGRTLSPKLGGYLAAAAFLVPLAVMGSRGRSRTIAAAVACCAATVLVLRVEVIS